MFRQRYAAAWTACLVAAINSPGRADEPRKLEGHRGEVLSLAFTPNSKQLVSSGMDGAVRIWDLQESSINHVIQPEKGPTFAVAVSPDGKTLATGWPDHSVRLWDVASGRALRELKGHTDRIASLAFTPDGERLASGSYDGTIRLWDHAAGRLVRVSDGKAGRVTSLAFWPDGSKLLAGGVVEETYRMGGTTISTGLADRVRLWSVEGKELRRFESRGSVVAVSLDGKTGFCGGLVMDIQKPAGGGFTMNGLDQITLIALASGEVERTFPWRGTALALSPDGRVLATGAGSFQHFEGLGYMVGSGANGRKRDTRVRLWEVASGQERLVLGEENATVLAFSPDGKILAAGTSDGPILLWSVRALPK